MGRFYFLYREMTARAVARGGCGFEFEPNEFTAWDLLFNYGHSWPEEELWALS